MLSFECDYSEGAHEAILKKLVETNMQQCSGYLSDPFCKSAAEKIKAACNSPDAEVFFLTGGTQTNAAVISAILQRYEGVLSAETGHVSVHEAGAIEYTGHKVLTLPHNSGKINAADVKDYFKIFYADGAFEHMVFPGMVYISQPTEYGTLYSKKELQDIKAVCEEFSVPLFVDGARLSYALAAADNDVSLADLASFCDVFYIGGTKAGALCGEAVVFPNGAPKHFFTMIKQQGALIAKGRLLGIQFDVLFTDSLFLKVGQHAVKQADKLRAMLKEFGFKSFIENSTNQIFVITENERLKELEKHVAVSFWEKYDDSHTVIRFATSWATSDEQLESLRDILKKLA